VKLDASPPLEPGLERRLLALIAAARPAAGSTGYDDAWRRAALHEGVEDEEQAGYAFSPRRTRGATRA
jgi:hypothetical protein